MTTLHREGLKLRFRRSSTRLSDAFWVAAYADGRVEQWKLDDSLWAGRRVAQRRVAPEEIAAASDLAQRVLRFPRPKMTSAHDPTEFLRLEVFGPAGPSSAMFSWGRASRTDAPLAPVSGEEAISAFDALVAGLHRLELVDHGQSASEATGAPPAPPAVTRAGSPSELARELVDHEQPAFEATSAPPAPPAVTRDGSPSEIARELVARQPSRLSELEAIIGTLSFCSGSDDGHGQIMRPGLFERSGACFSPSVHAVIVESFDDVSRERRDSLDDGRVRRDPGLRSYSLEFTFGRLLGRWQRKAVRDAVTAVGQPQSIAETPLGPGVRCGDFYLFGEGQRLHWYAEVPDWAQARPDEARRERWISELVLLLTAGCSHAELAAYCEAPAPGVRSLGSLGEEDCLLALEPAMEAVACARALGLCDALAATMDMHGRAWYLVAHGDGADVGAFVLPDFGRWTVDAQLDGWPQERSAMGVHARKFKPVYDLVHCAPGRVRRLFIHPRRG
jgi:hypothetical protein